MKNSETVFVVETEKTFEQAVIAVRKATESLKWGVLGNYDFSEILASKGFPQSEKIKSLDICSPGHANAFINEDRLTALCMPCSVLVFTEQGKTKIAALRPSAVLPKVFPAIKNALTQQAQQIDDQLKTILDTARI